ncbi:MAG: efflux RND transporter permease subunit, partial [Planctomycetes bacterium]|nr:efflux RND transporter permease subunit [Planctomycetota bacterium]
ALGRPVTVSMVLVAALLVGAVAYARMPVQLMPAGFTPPHLGIWIPYPQANPREVEESIAHPLEEALGTLRHVRQIRTTSSSNGCQVSLRFQPQADMGLAYSEVTDRLNRVRPRFPAEADRYFVWKNDINDAPVVWMGIALGPAPGESAPAAAAAPRIGADPYTRIEKRIKPLLERLPGVAKVELDGLVDQVVTIDLDPVRVKARHLDVYGLVQQLRSANFTLAGGVVEDGGRRYLVRSVARLDDFAAIRNLPVAPGVRLSEVAEVGITASLRERVTRIDRRPAVTVAIYRESTANTVAVCKAVRRVVEQEIPREADLADLSCAVLFDQGQWIGEAVDNLVSSAWQGGVLAVLVLFLFLFRVRMTLIVALSIPASFLITLGILYFTGETLNLITLMGLTLAVGMLVDNSIVVVENIYRLRQLGAQGAEASVRGAGEVALAIVLSTGSTIVVFLPLALMSDSAEFRFYMGRLGAPVCWALGASLLVALVFVPLAARTVGGSGLPREPRLIAWARHIYGMCLAWTLDRRLDAALLIVALFAATWYPWTHVKKVDAVEGHPGTVSLNLRFPEHFTLDDADRQVERLEELLLAHRAELSLRDLFVSFRENRAWVGLFLRSQAEAGYRVEEVIDRVKALLPTLPGVELRVNWKNSDAQDNGVTLRLHGEDTQTLLELGEEVGRRVRDLPGVLGVDTELEGGGREIHVTVDRGLARKQGIDSWAVGATVAYALRGSMLPEFVAGGRSLPMRVRFSEEVRESLDLLRGVGVYNSAGREVPLSAVADFTLGKGPGTIVRENRKSTFEVRIQTRKDDLEEFSRTLDRALGDLALPRGYTWDKGTRFSRMQENAESFIFAILLSIVFIFLLMGLLFESLLLPLAVLAAIPFAFSGVYWTMWATGTPLDMMASIGIIVLVGVVVNNAIVLVDAINRLRAAGWDRRAAILEAGEARFRPIWMTALTTIVGLIPMAVGDSNIMGIPYYPLGRAILGGLLASTVVSLVVVPLLYTGLDDLSRFARRMAGEVLGFGRSGV